ncbi:uncharacterized protein BT62DRAFT_1013244 [Guyanagaster necrorhizus]|uniref:Uncharacterized protein n=1 Tax=Guyanagaster necrorhizus TaxID=856835 RepID=A0A9P7VFT0_9AGAR|nr:uncharacterized protein BT62DRAFT_1013244 [Guyanagaster necrorhizus MCA 3950]KAG7439914.1 hypothetical protein BT62DRAFT_1013244 [Guyanagaster necrorhizus MCA 3950]
MKAGKLQSQNIVINATDTPGLFHVPGGYSALLQEKQELEYKPRVRNADSQ